MKKLKKLSEQNAPTSLLFPPPPTPLMHGAELWGAESLQSPTLTGPPARGSSNALGIYISSNIYFIILFHYIYD